MEFKTGDLIEATRGESVIRGRLTDDDEHVGDLFWDLYDLKYYGFEVRLIERPEPVLPTVPGFYVRKPSNDEPIIDYAVASLDNNGDWFINDQGYDGDEALEHVTRWNRDYGLIRLVPEQ